MFEKLTSTNFSPEKPTMIWDGDCGFCKYWIIQWQKMTGGKIDYVPYQEVSQRYKDIDVKFFKEAVRLIEPGGKIYNGPEAAYRAYQYAREKEWLLPVYRKFNWFRVLSDKGYDYIANNRKLMMKITRAAFGKDPENPKPYWLLYFIGFILLINLIKKDEE